MVFACDHMTACILKISITLLFSNVRNLTHRRSVNNLPNFQFLSPLLKYIWVGSKCVSYGSNSARPAAFPVPGRTSGIIIIIEVLEVIVINFFFFYYIESRPGD